MVEMVLATVLRVLKKVCLAAHPVDTISTASLIALHARNAVLMRFLLHLKSHALAKISVTH